jgi:hypothetical protein
MSALDQNEPVASTATANNEEAVGEQIDIEQMDIERAPESAVLDDLNAKHPFWNSSVSNLSDEEILELFHKSGFEISAQQCPSHYSPAGNCDALDITVHQNIGPSSVTCFYYPGLRSLINNILHAVSQQD